MILTFVMQKRATRKVPKAVAKVKSFLFLLRILKSSERPVMTASMPPIWGTQTERDMTFRHVYRAHSNKVQPKTWNSTLRGVKLTRA